MPDALRLVLRRASAQRDVLAVAGVVLLLTVVLVTSCSIALRTASQASLRTGLERAVAADRVVVVSGNPDDDAGLEAADAAVRDLVEDQLAPATAEVVRRAVSATYEQRGGSPDDRLVLGAYDDIGAHASLAAGEWAASEDEVAVPVAAAEALSLRPGDPVTLLGQDGTTRRLTVTGTWAADDPDDGYWAEDPLGATGVRDDGGFRTLGPLLLREGAGLDELVDPRVAWLATPRLDAASQSDLDRVRAGVDALEETGPRRLEGELPDPEVVTRLDDVLGSLGPSLTAARTAVVVPALLLLALAVASLTLAGRVVAEARSADVRLRESRGFSRRQVLRDAGTEVLALGVLVLAAGPWLAPGLVRGALSIGDARTRGVGLTAQDWVWAAATALGAVVLLTRAAAGGTTRVRATTGWRRLLPTPGVVVEVLVVVLAAVAWQQSATTPDGVLPTGTASYVVAAAPTLLVLALLLLVARVLPVVVRTTGGWVRRTRGLVVPVVGWELTRRVEQHRSALVTTGLAVAVSTLLAGLLGSWTATQDDRAAVETGAPVRVTGLTSADADALVADVGGVVVDRRSAAIGDVTATALLLDRGAAAGVLDSPVDGNWPALLARLEPGSPQGDEADVPALVSPALARQAGDGDELAVRLSDATVSVRIVGVVDALPTVDPTAPALLVDGAALRAGLGRDPVASVSTDDTEVWTDRRPTGQVPGEVLDREEVAEELRTGPVGTGLLAGAVLALVAAAMLGVLASLSDTATALRGRRHELAALRAQGLAGRSMVAALVGERALLLVGSAAIGAAVGWGVLRLLLTRLVVGDTGALPPEAVASSVPWLLVLGGTTLAVVLLLGQVLLAARRTARRPLGSDLREAT